MGGRRIRDACPRYLARGRGLSPSFSARRGHATSPGRCVGVDGKSLCGIPRLSPRCRCARRIQRQVHVQSIRAARRLLRHSRHPHPRDLSEFLPTARALAIFGNKARPMIARELVHLPDWAVEVEHGLRRKPKSLPSKLFYDAIGSALFEEITRLPEYYLTRTELQILEQNASDIAQAAGPGIGLVELGAGSAAKTCTLLRALLAAQLRVTYYAIDISASALAQARTRIESECPAVQFR